MTSAGTLRRRTNVSKGIAASTPHLAESQPAESPELAEVQRLLDLIGRTRNERTVWTAADKLHRLILASDLTWKQILAPRKYANTPLASVRIYREFYPLPTDCSVKAAICLARCQALRERQDRRLTEWDFEFLQDVFYVDPGRISPKQAACMDKIFIKCLETRP